MASQLIRRCSLVFVLALAAGWLLIYGGLPERAPSAPLAAEKSDLPFEVPKGFVAERVAGPPVVEYPITAEFDERGRLFVSHSSGLNVRNTEKLLKETPHSIRLLEPVDDRGKFTKFTVFADKMTFPTGALWYDGALYCCSAPYLWKMQDTQGAGVADLRQQLVGKFEFDGHAADIKGPFLGPDGRLYWPDGEGGGEVRRKDGTLLSGGASRIFRCKTDGSDLELICGGGMGNPVMMTFAAEGEPFATTTLINHYPNRWDGLLYCIDGGAFPQKDPGRLHGLRLTGDLLTEVANLGHVSPSGLVRYRSGAFGPEYRDNLFVTYYNTHKVQRLIVERDGASFRVRAEDFVVSSYDHFHPTYVLEDADGSLLVVDTGGWITVACYVSLLKPEAKGGIYRIRRAGVLKVADPRGRALKWDQLKPPELVKLLDDPRFAVRDQAVLRLAKQGAAALPALKETLEGNRSVQARRNAVWALTRMETSEATALLRTGLDDKDVSVRLSAAHSVALERDAEARDRLMDLVVKDTPAVRREAATALGRIKNGAAVPALFEGLRSGGDRYLEHALIYALIEIADRQAILKGLSDRSPQVRRGALIALDRMEKGNLTQELVTPLLDTDDPALQKTALAVLTSRGWAKQIIGLLRQWLAEKDVPAERQESLRGCILALAKDQAIQQLVAQTLERPETSTATRSLLLETIARAPLDQLPDGWSAALGRALDHAEEPVVRQAVAAIRARRVTQFDAKLFHLAQEQNNAADLRVAALAGTVSRLPQVEPVAFDLLRGQLAPEVAPLARLDAATALGNARLTDDQLGALTKNVAGAGSLEIPHLLAAYERSKTTAVGRKLVDALARSPGLSNLSSDALRRTLQGYPDEVRQAAQPLFKKLDVDTDKMKARLAELAPVLKGGHAGRGQTVFYGTKASCAACHTVRSKGGLIGPDLSTIGAVRSGSDLLEAIAFPSASFARGYEPYVVTTNAGKFYPAGIIKRETADAIYLTTGELAEIRISRAEIDTILPGKVSIMPQGLDVQLTRQELSDLIAFLQSLK